MIAFHWFQYVKERIFFLDNRSFTARGTRTWPWCSRRSPTIRSSTTRTTSTSRVSNVSGFSTKSFAILTRLVHKWRHYWELYNGDCIFYILYSIIGNQYKNVTIGKLWCHHLESQYGINVKTWQNGNKLLTSQWGIM